MLLESTKTRACNCCVSWKCVEALTGKWVFDTQNVSMLGSPPRMKPAELAELYSEVVNGELLTKSGSSVCMLALGTAQLAIHSRIATWAFSVALPEAPRTFPGTFPDTQSMFLASGPVAAGSVGSTASHDPWSFGCQPLIWTKAGQPLPALHDFIGEWVNILVSPAAAGEQGPAPLHVIATADTVTLTPVCVSCFAISPVFLLHCMSQSDIVTSEDPREVLNSIAFALYHSGYFPPHASGGVICAALTVLAECCEPNCGYMLVPLAAQAIDEAFVGSAPPHWLDFVLASPPFPVRPDLQFLAVRVSLHFIGTLLPLATASIICVFPCQAVWHLRHTLCCAALVSCE